MRVQYYAGTCNLQPITAYRPVDGISPLSGVSAACWLNASLMMGAANFLVSFISVMMGVLAIRI